MDFFSGVGELSETSEIKGTEEKEISSETNKKFDKLMGDDKISESSTETKDECRLSPEERENKFDSLFDMGDFFEEDMYQSEHKFEDTDGETNSDLGTVEYCSDQDDVNEQEPDYSEARVSNSTYEFNGNVYETDDNGQTYKKNGQILSNTEYTVNGNTYETDENGNKISCDANPKYTEDGSRNVKEQKESGGEERQEDDDGGHIIARILGGAEGEENLVPMRRTINRGDYKKMENEIAKALQEGKEVSVHIDINYEGDSSRPSKLKAEYTIDGKKTICEFDNVEGSTDLLDSLKDKISDEDYDRLKQTLDEMKEDGCDAAITSVKVEYDENGDSTKVTVGVLDESTGTKNYKVYSPN